VLTRPIDDACLRQVAAAFAIPGRYAGAVPYGTGHINDTFAATFERAPSHARYILQRINDTVFPAPVALMGNVERVVAHLRRGSQQLGIADLERRVLTLIAARDGRCYHADDDGHIWRCYVFIEGAHTHDVIAGPEQAYQGALAFGRFQRALADYDGPRLSETIPGFHHTTARLQALAAAVDRDPCNRAAACRAEIELALAQAPLAGVLLDLQARGVLPERITHNDTKLNNVLFDDATGEGICVLDLDTVMPGLSLYDFGDMVRSATSLLAEDHPDATAVRVQVPIFAALVRGYLAGAADTVLPVEREHLVTAGRLLTYECGIRFLTDHLHGDRYFKVHRPGHNLDRARAQLALLRSLAERADELERVVHEIATRP